MCHLRVFVMEPTDSELSVFPSELCPVSEQMSSCPAQLDSGISPHPLLGEGWLTLSSCRLSRIVMLGLILCCMNSPLSTAGDLIKEPAASRTSNSYICLLPPAAAMCYFRGLLSNS